MATVITNPGFEFFHFGPEFFLPGVANFPLTHGALIDALAQTDVLTATLPTSNPIEVTARNSVTGEEFTLVVSGSGIAPVTTQGAVEQAIMNGLASGALNRISVADSDGMQFLSVDVSATGYKLASGQQTLVVQGALPGSLTEIGGLAVALENLDTVLRESPQPDAFAALLTQLDAFSATSVSLNNAGMEVASIDVSQTVVRIEAAGFEATGFGGAGFTVEVNGDFSDFLGGGIPSPALIVDSVVVTDPSGTEIASIRDIVDLTDLGIALDQVIPQNGFFEFFGPGDDSGVGGAGSDELIGEGGNDTLAGGRRGDMLFGDEGNDSLMGEAGDDGLFGGPGDDTLLGGADNDDLYGDDGNDIINPGDNAGGATGFDTIQTGSGNDIVDMVDVVNGFVTLDYGFLSFPGHTITAMIDGGTNTGTVNKGAAGLDTLLNVNNALNAGWATGGLSIRGTTGTDTFDLTPQGQQWMSVRGGNGADTFTINGTGLVRLDFRDAFEGIEVDLGARTIANDGFGWADTLLGTAPIWEVQGTVHNDMFTGSNNGESYRALGGNDTLDGGLGFDRLRYDRPEIASVNIDAQAATVTGLRNDFFQGTTPGQGGTPFKDTILGFEWLRGSDGSDAIGGNSSIDNKFDGGGGTDAFIHVGGNDTISDFDPGSESLFVRVPGAGLSKAAVDTAVANATDVATGALVTFGGGFGGPGSSVLFEGVSATDLAQADVRFVPPSGVNLVLGTDGDDSLAGTPGDDIILTRDASPNGDFVSASTGNDVIDMSGLNQSSAFVTVSYSGLGAGVTVDLDGAANTATVDKGANGTDIIKNVENPLIAGFDLGGLGIIGTAQGDTFNLAPGVDQWMQVRAGDGADSFTIGNDGLVRLDFAFTGATQGVVVDLEARTITNDGFSNTETISGPGTIWEVRGTDFADDITGGTANESFISRGGNDVIDGGGGVDRLRYDRGGVDGIQGDLGAGTVTGTWDGNAFTDTISNIEWLRGSNSSDTLTGDTLNNRLEGSGGTDFFFHVGGNDTISDFDPGSEAVFVRTPGLSQAAVDAAISAAVAQGGDTLVTFEAGSSILFSGVTPAALADANVQFIAPGPVGITVGTDGNDQLIGTSGNDLIITGNATPNGDFVIASTGNDTIDMSGNDGANGFVTLGYGALTGPVSVTIDGATNTGTVSKGGQGTDTLIGVAQPLSAGWINGGLGILGTAGNDAFNLASDGLQWMSVRGGAGTDGYTINGTGLVRMDFRGAAQGIEVDLAARQIANDGFGNAETIGGTGSVWEVYGSGFDDMVAGSNADESYRYFGGNNMLDGGAGFDRLRYDVGEVASVDLDAARGRATGTLNDGSTFTDTITGFEWLRGSNGDDTIAGEAGVDNQYEGRGGVDTFIHEGGNDTIGDFNPFSGDRVFVRMEVPDQAAVDAALDAAVDTEYGALVTFASGTVLFDGVRVENLRFADVQALQADVPPPPPPPTPIGWTVGDPHLLTLDGVGYDFHAIGEFVLLRGTSGGSFSGFEIQSRMGPVLDSNDNVVPNVSANVAIAARAADGTEVMIDATDASPLSIGGVATALDDGASTDVGADRVFRQGDTYTLVFAGADGTVGDGDARMSVVVRDGFVDVGVQISTDMAGQVEGLLGDGNGNPDNDIALADGTVLARPLAFEDLYGNAGGTVPNLRDDWRVTTDGQSLFTYDAGETLAGFYDPTAPAGDPTAGATDQQVADARAAVEAAGLTPGTLAFENAVQDVLLTGDTTFIASSSTETAPTPANTGSAGTLAAGDTRVTLDVSLTDEGGNGIGGAVVNFSTGGAPILGQAAGTAGSYTVGLGSSTGAGRVDAVRDFETGDGTIDVSDALNALRLTVGMNPSFGPADAKDFIAADVDQSGAVGVDDALDILRSVVGMDTPNAPRWVFLDDAQDLSGIDVGNVVYQTGIDTGPIDSASPLQLSGVLLGDILAPALDA